MYLFVKFMRGHNHYYCEFYDHLKVNNVLNLQLWKNMKLNNKQTLKTDQKCMQLKSNKTN